MHETGVISRFAQSDEDVMRCQALRHRSFRKCEGIDSDAFDALSQHVMIEEAGVLVGTLRLRVLPDLADLNATYTGGFYAISGLAGPSLEIGRFCVAPDATVPHVLREAWAVLTRVVDTEDIQFIFGCASFEGTDPVRYADAFALLRARHQGKLKIGVKAIETKRLCDVINPHLNPTAAGNQLPALLRSYLAMGGFVSDHLVIDRALGTLHVFTAVEIAKIPPARARALRRAALN
jgi:putative hemolysin